MPVPAPDIMLADVGQAQQHAVVAHCPEHIVGHLLEVPGDDAVLVEQLGAEDGQVAALVAVALEVVAQVADDRPARLDVEGGRADDDRRHVGGAGVALLARVDRGRADDAVAVALDGPLGAVRQHNQLAADLEQMAHRVDLPAGELEVEGVVGLDRRGCGEVGPAADLRQPDALGGIVGVGQGQALLDVGDGAGVAVRLVEPIILDRRGQRRRAGDVGVVEGDGCGARVAVALADELVDAVLVAVEPQAVVGAGIDHGQDDGLGGGRRGGRVDADVGARRRAAAGVGGVAGRVDAVETVAVGVDLGDDIDLVVQLRHADDAADVDLVAGAVPVRHLGDNAGVRLAGAGDGRGRLAAGVAFLERLPVEGGHAVAVGQRARVAAHA